MGSDSGDSADELKTFKLGDAFREGMSKPSEKAGSAAEPKPNPSQSLGYTRVEQMLENTSPEEIQSRLRTLEETLNQKQSEKDATMKTKSRIKKVLAAIQETHELFDYLFNVQAELEASLQSGPKKKGK